MKEPTKNTIKFSTSLPISLSNKMVKCIATHKYSSRSAFIASAVRDKIKSLESIDINHVADNISEIDRIRLMKLLTKKG